MPFNRGDGFRRGKKGNPARRPEKTGAEWRQTQGSQTRRQIRSRLDSRAVCDAEPRHRGITRHLPILSK